MTENRNTYNRAVPANSSVYNAVTGAALCFVFLNSMGFPGSYARVFGGAIKPLIEYTSFFIQLALMLFVHADSLLDVTVINLKGKFGPVYAVPVIFGITSMMVTSDPKEQIVSCVRVFVTVMFAIWVVENIDIYDILRSIFAAQVLYTAFAAAFPVLFPAYDYRPASYVNDFVGIGGVKNVAASELAFGIMMQTMLWKMKVEREEWVSYKFRFFMVIQMVLLLMTHGTGALFTCAIPAVYVLYIYERIKKRLPLGVIYIVVTVSFLIVAMTILPLFEPLLNMLGKDATLTGRIPLWTQLISVMQKNHPFTGYGYGMFWKDERAIEAMHAGFDEFSFMGNMTSGSHNSLMELWACNGLIGIGAFFYAMYASFLHVDKMKKWEYLFCAGYMIYYTMEGLTERNWGTFDYPLMFIFMVLGMGNKRADERGSPWSEKEQKEESAAAKKAA